MKTKTIGIIGGFGPEATAQFYLELIKEYRKANRDQQPHIIVRNVSVPRKLEHDALILGKSLHLFEPFLTSMATNLQEDGADIITLPCNTLHIHEKAIRSSVHVPFISIITASIRFLHKRNISHVGLLGSRMTIQNNLFKQEAPDIEFIAVDTLLQKKIDHALDLFVSGKDSSLLRTAIREAFSFLTYRGINDVLTACTDFHQLCPSKTNLRVHDTLDILVHATVSML